MPLSFGGRVPYVTNGTYGLPKSSSQTASRSVQPFLYGFRKLYCTIHRQWGGKLQNYPFPLGFRHPAGGPNHGHRQHERNKSSAVAEMGDRSHNRHGLKRGGLLCPFREAGTPSNTMWPGPRPTSMPSAILIHNRHGPKIWGLRPFFGGRGWVPIYLDTLSSKHNLCHAGSSMHTVLFLNFFDDPHYYYLD